MAQHDVVFPDREPTEGTPWQKEGKQTPVTFFNISDSLISDEIMPFHENVSQEGESPEYYRYYKQSGILWKCPDLESPNNAKGEGHTSQQGHPHDDRRICFHQISG